MSDLTVFNSQNDIQKYGEDVFKQVSKAGDYLRRVQLCGGNSKVVKSGTIPIGTYAIFTDSKTAEPLGNELLTVPIVWRPKALRLEETKEGQKIFNYYDPKNADFMKVVEESEVQDSGCMYGPEYLIWIPKIKELATFYCNSKTQRRAANSLQPLLKNPVVFKVQLIETKKYSWHGSVFLASSEPITALPEKEKLDAEVQKFLNPPENDVEIEEGAKAEETERAR